MNEPLRQLRRLMAERQIDAYLIVACDDHQSEYFSEYFETTRFLSHFTGESCTLVITQENAGLWTDGRFFVQAEAQMDRENFTLYRSRRPGVPTVAEYLADTLSEGACLGFYGRLIDAAYLDELMEKLSPKNIRLAWREDLAGMVWEERPALVMKPARLLPLEYVGRSAADKLESLRQAMAEQEADFHILSSLDDIAWLFNLRGDDIPHNPVALAYALISRKDASLYLAENAADETMRQSLAGSGVTLKPYDDIYADTAQLPAGSAVLVSKRNVNMALVAGLPEGCRLIDAPNPTTRMKAVKNETEIECLTRCHIRDGVAMTRFMYWLKTHIGREPITEISASDVLAELRREQGAFDLSFDTISAYGANAAMMHYTATPETDAVLKPEGFLLVDSGGQYMIEDAAGTTDITRTFVLGPITEEQKRHFTAVARGMLNLADAKFPEGCSGLNLDYLARHPMWEMGIDYLCGTGHGVGYILNVHEGPQSFHWEMSPRKRCETALVPGMVTTDEPGVYLDYRYGIRTENELLCVKDEKTEYAQFLRFRHLTYCPIDLDGIDPRYMSPQEIRLLNDYHAMVYETLKGLLTPEEAGWLAKATRPL